MHEFSVTKSLVDLCEKEATSNGIKKILKIKVKLGKFTGFSTESIRFYFEYLKPNTKCAEAQLIFNEIPILVKCSNCGYKAETSEPVFLFPDCVKPTLEIISGREFFVESIEGDQS